MTNRRLCIAILPLLTLLLTGCFSYSFTGSVPSHLKTVSIPTLEDRTAEFGLRESVTDALIAAFRRDNTLGVVDETRADAVLTGEIQGISEAPVAYLANATVTQNQVTVTVNFKFFDKLKGKALFEGPISAWGAYNPADGVTGRQKAIDDAIRKLADDVIAKTLSGW